MSAGRTGLAHGLAPRTRLGGSMAGLPPISRRFAAWMALLLVVMAVGGLTWLYQMQHGLGVTNLRNTVMWGQYILFFMFFVGLSAGGLIVASSGRLFGVTRFKPIVRLAVLEATVAIMLAGSFIIPDLGRPERMLNLFFHANLTSPMVWDVTIVLLYLGLSATYVWLYTRADLARRGSWLALGTGASASEIARDERLKSALAWVALPSAILLHSITAWIFGLQISRDFWYTSIMAPMFISSALVSGLALVILLALIVRWGGRVRFDDALVGMLGGLLAVFIAVEAFFVFAEYLTAAYPGAADADAVARMIAGPYSPLLVAEVVGGLLLPFLVLARSSWRGRPWIVGSVSVVAIVGIFVHRLNLVLNGLSYPPVGMPPGVSVGEPQVGASFAMNYWYVPSLVEWLIVAGVLALGAFLFSLAAWYLPLQEEVH